MNTKILLAAILLSAPLGAGEIDRCINAELSRSGITTSAAASPERLVRRYYLVVTDRIPTETQTSLFLGNPDKEALVDSLLASDGFARKLVMKWGDLLRIKSEFPSCMWPNAVQAYNKWLLEEFRANTPYNRFVSDLLMGTGSNFRVPQINFYRAGSDRSTDKFTSDIALLFLGRRSAPEEWKPFFSQIKFKSSKEWKEEILCLDINVQPPFKPIKLGKSYITLEKGTDYRKPFVEWLTADDNRELAAAFVNRFWFWMMGTGIANPVDDLDNAGKPSSQELWDYLTDSFIKSGFNVRALAREILLSDAFCRSTISETTNEADKSGFSHFKLSRMGSEQLCDALCDITEVYDKYSSRAPEPFTNFPDGTHANEVCDGTITTPQLDIFGRPSRDVALESARDNSVNAKQMLYLLNSNDIQEKLQKSPYLKRLPQYCKVADLTSQIYLRVLSRLPSPEEIAIVEEMAAGVQGSDRTRRIGATLIWALVNTDEFLFIN